MNQEIIARSIAMACLFPLHLADTSSRTFYALTVNYGVIGHPTCRHLSFSSSLTLQYTNLTAFTGRTSSVSVFNH